MPLVRHEEAEWIADELRRKLLTARIEVDRLESGSVMIRAVARTPREARYQEYINGYVAGFLAGAERGMMRPKSEL